MMCGERTESRESVGASAGPLLACGLAFGLALLLALLLTMGCDRPITHADQKADQGASKTEATASSNPVDPQPAPPAVKQANVIRSGKAIPASKQSSHKGAPEKEITAKGSIRKGVIETTFDDIKFEMEKTEPFVKSMLTPQVEQLFDQSIRIRGYIYPTLRKRGLKQFVLVRDNLECCFGPGAALFDCILVRMVAGKTAEYTIRPVAVEGTFRFEEFLGPDGKHLAIYCLDGEKVD